MNILVTLCGRAGSKGVRGKNVRDFNGIPLVWYSLAALCLYKERYTEDDLDLVLNTDSLDLQSLVSSVDEILVTNLKRDEEHANDSSSKVDVIKDSLSQAEAHFKKSFDIVLDLDITSPLRTVEDIRNAIVKKKERDDVDAVFSVAPSRRNPYFNMVKEENGYFGKAIPSKYTSRQQAPVFYDMNASIYAYSASALKRKASNVFFNDRCYATIMKDTGILDIDSEEDYELMQVVSKYLIDKDSRYREIYTKARGWKK